jgi:RNA polymerase sigma-70 factor (ECF subfamily)
MNIGGGVMSVVGQGADGGRGGSSVPRAPDLAALYANHRVAMRRAAAAYLRTRGTDPKLADDAVGEVVRRLQQSGPPANVPADKWEAYLVRAAINAAKDQIKSISRRPDQLDRMDDIGVTYADEPDPTNVEDEVLDALQREQAVRRVRSALNALPSTQQTVVAGRHLKGRTNQDLASELGVTEARISQIHKQGVRALAEYLVEDPR